MATKSRKEASLPGAALVPPPELPEQLSTLGFIEDGPPVFARHDTFHPRHGWIKKGYDAVVRTPDIFALEDAPVRMGVGKNMVRAIRYWCEAFGVTASDARSGRSRTTEFGKWLLDDQSGKDPFLEDAASLWMLHWRLLRRGGMATAWRFTFFEFTKFEFTADDLTLALEEYVRQHFPTSTRFARSSLEKDASCVIRMYAQDRSRGVPSEEAIHCPFTSLSLLRGVSGGRGRVTFEAGEKHSLPPTVVAAACIERLLTSERTARTISLADLTHGYDAPGLAFRLGEGALYHALERASELVPGFGVVDTAGITQLVVQDDPLAVHANLRLASFSAGTFRGVVR